MKRERIYVEMRRKQILEAVRANPRVMVDELAQKFDVSLITIRRDLQYLEDQSCLSVSRRSRAGTSKILSRMKYKCTGV